MTVGPDNKPIQRSAQGAAAEGHGVGYVEEDAVAEVPDWSNFYSALNTSLSREQVAGLHGALGWKVRKCT
ncbi:MAG: hypothetical protein AB1486_01015 [Planctomycetota bacterium]